MEFTRLAALLLFTLTNYFAISYSQYIADYTWVTSVDGKVAGSNVYCSNCEVICDIYDGCYDSNFYCTSGDCSLNCVEEKSCSSTNVYDSDETKFLNISCVGQSSCPSGIYWEYDQSIVQLFTEENTDYDNYVRIIGPDYQGKLKTWNQNCELGGSCESMRYHVSETDISLVCGQSYSCSGWTVYYLSKSVVSIESSDTYGHWNMYVSGSSMFDKNIVTVHGDFSLYWQCDNTKICTDNIINMYDTSYVKMSCGDVESCVNNTVAIHDSTVVTWDCNEDKACVNNTVLVYDSAQIDWNCATQYACYNFTVNHVSSESSTDNDTLLLLAN